MAGNLILHAGANPITRAELRTLPTPVALGPRHRPLPYHEIVDSLFDTFPRFNLVPTKEQYGVTKDAARLFAVITFQPRKAGDTALSLGIRSSISQFLALRGVFGENVFVCDNLVFNGSEFLFNRKNTTNASVKAIVEGGLDKFLEQEAHYDAFRLSLQNLSLTDEQAAKVFVDMIAKQQLPERTIAAAVRNYFDYTDKPDCAPRSAWGVHNAFTRVLRDASLPVQFEQGMLVSRLLSPAPVEAEVVPEVVAA